jgi:hypothetical protein
MFNFLSKVSRKKKQSPEKIVATEIGTQLQICIRSALHMNKTETRKRFNLPFVSKYIVAYVNGYFISKGCDGERGVNRYLEEICEGLIADKLYTLVSKYKNIDEQYGGNWGELEITEKTAKEYADGDISMGGEPRSLECFLTGKLE